MVAPTHAKSFHTVDGCFCDDVTNVLSCDHPLKEEYCFCNEDSNLRCSTDTPPIGSPVYSTTTKEDSVTFPISSFICDSKHMEIEHDTVIRVGDSVRVCLLPQDTTGGDLTSIKEIIDVTCSNRMDQAFSIIPISVQDELDQATFEFSNGAGRGFQTIIKREYTHLAKVMVVCLSRAQDLFRCLLLLVVVVIVISFRPLLPLRKHSVSP